jgi:hypothetical protein
MFINDEPLGFYHFSGFDSGDQQTMLHRYGKESPVLHDLREWYVDQCERHGQSALGDIRCKYDDFSNGESISRGYRLLYRQREDLQRAYPNPYMVAGANCYKAWYDANPTEHLPTGSVQIKYGVPITTILTDLARQFNSLIVAGRGGSRVKRLILKFGVQCLRFTAWVAGRGRKH